MGINISGKGKKLKSEIISILLGCWPAHLIWSPTWTWSCSRLKRRFSCLCSSLRARPWRWFWLNQMLCKVEVKDLYLAHASFGTTPHTMRSSKDDFACLVCSSTMSKATAKKLHWRSKVMSRFYSNLCFENATCIFLIFVHCCYKKIAWWGFLKLQISL